MSLATIEQYRQQFLEWGVGEILLYGCNVATAADFILRLHQLTGAQIKAQAELPVIRVTAVTHFEVNCCVEMRM